MIELTKQRLAGEIATLIRLNGDPIIQKENRVSNDDIVDIMERVLAIFTNSNLKEVER